MESTDELILSILSNIHAGEKPTGMNKELVVARRLHEYMALTSDRSATKRMLDSTRIPARITRVEFENSSQRYVVHFVASGCEEEEIVRTDRIDGARGSFVREMLGDIDKLPGKGAIIYKTNEEMKSRKGQTFRIAPYIHVA